MKPTAGGGWWNRGKAGKPSGISARRLAEVRQDVELKAEKLLFCFD
jgi:hypothetical protein